MTLLSRIYKRVEKTSKEYYSSYKADDKIRPINEKLVSTILSYKPNSVLEFGCGVGKNLRLINQIDPHISLLGIDISKNNVKHRVINCVSRGDENELLELGMFDIVFTCSVLDHIKDIDEIIKHFKLMTKRIISMETNSYDTNYYYKHDYQSLGFKNQNYFYQSTKETGGDGATYELWVNE